VSKITDMNTNCIIGEGSIFEGRFFVNGPVLIEGKFQGEIRTDDQVVIGPTGKVKTDITARKVTVSGTIIGNISASEEVNLLSTGKVLGNITTPKINVEPGVITRGIVTITSDSENVENIINTSYGNDAETEFKNINNEPTGKEKKIRSENDKTKE